MGGRMAVALGLILLLTALPGGPARAAKANCKEIRQAQVSGKEFVQEGSKYQELRELIIQQCLLDAVKQTLGTEIKRNVGSSESMVNDKITDKFDELTVEKVRGYIDSYDVVREDLVEKGKMTLLEIDLAVNVCVPDESQIQQVVVGGDFLGPDGNQAEDLKAVFFSHFPTGSKKLQLASYPEGGGYRDIVITGRVVDLSVTRAPKTGAAGAALGAAIVGSFLGGRLAGAIAGGSQGDAQRMKAVVTAKAVTVADHSTVSVTKEAQRDIPLQADPKAESVSLISEALASAAEELFAKLNGGGGFFTSSSGSSSSSSTAPSEH